MGCAHSFHGAHESLAIRTGSPHALYSIGIRPARDGVFVEELLTLLIDQWSTMLAKTLARANVDRIHKKVRTNRIPHPRFSKARNCSPCKVTVAGLLISDIYEPSLHDSCQQVRRCVCARPRRSTGSKGPRHLRVAAPECWCYCCCSRRHWSSPPGCWLYLRRHNR